MEGKVVIITGAGRGIGKETAIGFIKKGAKVIIADLHNAEETAKELGCSDNVLGLHVDVSKADSIKQMVEKAMNKYGRIDVLINNAGVGPTTAMEDITEEEWDSVLAINLKSVFFCSQAVSGIMKNQNYGRIINISSLAARWGSVVSGCHYTASKAGIIGLTKAMARQLGSHNITVNAIAPGTIDSEMTRTYTEEAMKNLLASVPLGRLGKQWYVAELAQYLCSDAAEWITGATIDLNGGMYMA